MSSLPSHHSRAYFTPKGTPYLVKPGVVMISRPHVDLADLTYFLRGFDDALKFDRYLDDPDKLDGSSALCKFAGQLCYASLGPKRTLNKDASKYFQNIKESGHGSVLEAANFSFLLYGVSRSLTHELVRHRIGGYSQISQRYVDGKVLRFVRRPEFDDSGVLHEKFEKRIDAAAAEYKELADLLFEKQLAGDTLLSAERKTDLRKKVNQAARACLPNETEAPIVVTYNARALRHVLEMRASVHAELEIRRLAVTIYQLVNAVAPLLFEDYELVMLDDQTFALETKYRKV